MSGKGFGGVGKNQQAATVQAAELPQEAPVEAWCPRCGSAQPIVVYQSMIQLGIGANGLAVASQCGTCHLLLWPMGLFAMQPQMQARPGGVIAVPGGRVH